MHKLTEFQKICEARVKEFLSMYGLSLLNKKLDGKNETYITAQIGEKGPHIWIYEDEAMIMGADIDVRFETYDYDTKQDLIEALIMNITIILDKVQCNNMRS